MATAEATATERTVTLTLTESEAATLLALTGKGHTADLTDGIYMALRGIRPHLSPRHKVEFVKDAPPYGYQYRIREA